MRLSSRLLRAGCLVGVSVLTMGGMASGPGAAYEVSPGRPSARSEVLFMDRSGAATSWLWMFGDGSTSTERNPTHVYEGPGSYPVTLRVSDGGVTTQTTTMVDVAPEDTLVLLSHDGHPFEVTLVAVNPNPSNGLPLTEQALAKPQNDVFGFFTFPLLVPTAPGAPFVPEVFVKILDARPIPGQDFWVFWGGLTTLEYTLTVKDTVRGTVKTYSNPVTGNPACLSADTSGFANVPTTTPTQTGGSPTPTPTPPAGSVHIVNIGQGGNQYLDASSGNHVTSVRIGETVQWKWTSGTHSSTSGECTNGGAYGNPICSNSGEWDSGTQSSPFQYSHTFSKAGTYKYFCGVHGSAMTGTVTVTQ